MINLPYVNMPEHFVKLLVSNIQNTSTHNGNLEIYFNDNKELNILIKKLFKDIDPEGFVGKIITVSGWTNIRNRLAAAFLEHAQTGKFPEVVNLTYITDILNIENKLRHFTNQGHSRAFLLAFYSKMSMIRLNKMEEVHQYSPLLITDQHLDLLKFSKSKSLRIDWLILQLVLFEQVLGTETLENLLKGQTKYNAIFNLLSSDEKEWLMENFLSYGSSILDFEYFFTDTSMIKEA